MTEENENLLELIDEDGNKVELEVLDVITLDNKEYALLLPPKNSEEEHTCEHEDCNCADDEVIVMRMKRDGEEYTLELIDDDNEFNRVSEYIEKLEDEIED